MADEPATTAAAESQKKRDSASDMEGDTFEDAQAETMDEHEKDSEMTPQPRHSSPAGRSLTERGSPSPAARARESVPPPVPPLPNGHAATKNTDGEEAAKVDGAEDPESEQAPLGKSPLLTVHRISVENLDEVNLEEDKGSDSPDVAPDVVPPPKVPPRDSNGSLKSMQGLSGTHQINFPPPPPAPAQPKTTMAPPAAPSRKLTSPFSWLSRATTGEKKSSVSSPPPPTVHERRGTTASMATIGSNPEFLLNDDNSSADGGPNVRASLKDRFKFLRMREEAGITSLDDEASGQQEPGSGGAIAGLIGRSASFALGSPGSLDAEENKDAAGMARTASSPGPKSPPLQQTPTVNPSLAPGTAAGMAAGPADEAAPPVDWDLWQSVVYEGPAAVARTSPEELNQAIASGIPHAIRGVVWQVLAESKNEGLEEMYRELVQRGTEQNRPTRPLPSPSRTHSFQTNGTKETVPSSASSAHSEYSTPATTDTSTAPDSAAKENGEAMSRTNSEQTADKERLSKADAASLQKLEKTIRRDLGARTSYSKYVMAAGLQEGLFGICKAYALFDQDVGYAQGMNFIAMPLLFNMPEEEAFSLFVRIMRKYDLREMFIQDMPGLHLHLYQFERLLEDFEPALYCHLYRRGVSPQLYATQWFLTLFAYRFPLQLVLRVYDLILSEGLTAILKFGIVLMQKNAQTLLGMKDMSALTTFLKEKIFDVYIDKAPSASSLLESGFFGTAGGIDKEVYRADVMVQDACSIKIAPETLKSYTAEWEEKQATAKSAEAELESLRTSNASLTAQVKRLEERVNKTDTEHVELASELVRTKVLNEQTLDENESLRGRIEELQKIVDQQPGEVEERLKTEMERIMSRNVEVHNENRALEEQLGEMEGQLVEAKMAYAEINADHETLKQKWSNLSALLNAK